MKLLAAVTLALVVGPLPAQAPYSRAGETPYAPDEGPGHDKEMLSRKSREEYLRLHPEGETAVASSDRPVPSVDIALDPVGDFVTGQPMVVRAQVTRGTPTEVILFARKDGSAIFAQVEMHQLGGTVWQAVLSPEFTESDTLRLYAQAQGDAGTPPAFAASAESPVIARSLPPPAPWAPPWWLYLVPLAAVAAWRLKVQQMSRTHDRQTARSSRPRRHPATGAPVPAGRRVMQPGAAGATTRSMRAGAIGAGGSVVSQQARPTGPTARTRLTQRGEE